MRSGADRGGDGCRDECLPRFSILDALANLGRGNINPTQREDRVAKVREGRWGDPVTISGGDQEGQTPDEFGRILPVVKLFELVGTEDPEAFGLGGFVGEMGDGFP